MKFEWRKKEKEIYLPGKKPVEITIPTFNYFSIAGSGNPNDADFGKCIEALYAISYLIRMSYKKGREPKGFYEYTVYPLEGFWDISEDAKKTFNGSIDKNELVYELMIRQPDFVTADYAQYALTWVREEKSLEFLDKLQFTQHSEGKSVQMMHIGSYDNEQESFKIMQEYCANNGLTRKFKQHKEIYISDPRKIAPEKLKTVLRFAVK